jgi:hypothetical protein
VKNNSTELGYNYLNTSFTGTISDQLTGNDLFPFLPEDRGVASKTSSKEFKSIDKI